MSWDYFLTKRKEIFRGLLLGAAIAFCFLVVPPARAADRYEVDIDLRNGPAELDRLFGTDGYTITGDGEFIEGEGFLLGMRSLIQIPIPREVPITHFYSLVEAKGFDEDMDVFGEAGKDGYFFSAWRDGWCDPWCDDPQCAYTNWGFGMKKWPSDMGGHPYEDSILMQGAGMRDGTAMPGGGNTDIYYWDDHLNEFYTIEVDLHSSNAFGSLTVREAPEAGGDIIPPGHPAGVPYRMPNLEPRDDISLRIGSEGPGGVSYGGVTVRRVHVIFEEEAAEPTPYDPPPPGYSCGNKDEDDPDNPYDLCACHGRTETETPPCEDAPVAGDPGEGTFLSQFPFGFSGATLDWKWKWDDLKKEAAVKEKQNQLFGSVNLDFAPPSPQEGEGVSAIATIENFRTRASNAYFDWCLVDGDNVWPMNSIVAGGTLPETAASKSWSDGGCCEAITRTPLIDQDDPDHDGVPNPDGMDDNWERTKFIGRAGTNYQTIEDVLPGDDPDNDGFQAGNFRNSNGELLTVTPPLVDSLGNFYPTGLDDKLTNIEEYLLGTDPLTGDTDGDGVGDEMDYLGVGQTTMQFDVNKVAGPTGYYDVSVTVLGIDAKKKVAISGTKQRLFIGNANKLEATLLADKEVITFGSDEPLRLRASVINGTEESNSLYYEWFFNGDSACNQTGYENPDLCGNSQNEIVLGTGGVNPLDLPPPTSEDYPIMVRILDEVNRDETEASLTLPVTYALPLTTVCGDQTEEIDSLPMGGDEPVLICISGIEELAQTSDLAKLNFIWSDNGVVDETQSGLGKSRFSLKSAGEAGEQHEVAVRIKDAARAREAASGHRVFSVQGPQATIVEPADRFETSDPVATAQTRLVRGVPGETITFQAEQKNFVGRDGWQVSWTVDGAEKLGYYQREYQAGEFHVFNFSVPPDAPSGQTYHVGIRISAAANDPPEDASDIITVVVGEPTGALGMAQPLLGTMAAAFTRIPEAARAIGVYAAIFAGIFFLLIFAYPKISRQLSAPRKKKF